MDVQENLERTWKVREFENKWLWQFSENLFILFKRGKVLLSHAIQSKPIYLLIGGYSYRKRICSPKGAILPLRVTPNFEVIQLAPFK